MTSDDLLCVRQDSCARSNGDLAICGLTWFPPIATNIIWVIQMDDIYIHITLKIPITQAAVVGIGSQLTLIKWFDKNVAAFQLFHNALVGK